MFEFFLALAVLFLFIFALIGFVYTIGIIFRRPVPDRETDRPNPSSGLGRALATCEEVDALFQNGKISKQTYQEMRATLESCYERFLPFPNRVEVDARQSPSEPGSPLAQPISPRQNESAATDDEIQIISATLVEPKSRSIDPATQSSNVPVAQTINEITVNEVTSNVGQLKGDQPTHFAQGHPSQSADQPVHVGATSIQRIGANRQGPASPFDVPDSPAHEPRQTFKEMLSRFMEKKNIRWGELASGILIIGSAVGLVFSLRDVLQDRIPYFSALLFMLITAAIHAAGIYTLKKWKLRNTSRGVLLIGLLLIPINFLAACILTGSGLEKRSLSDPLYWIAIGVGVVCFGVMTWQSTKSLFRKYGLPIAVGLLGMSAWTLVVNRVEGLGGSVWTAMTLIGPPAVLFVFCGLNAVPRQWSRTYLGPRMQNRALMVLGVLAFAFINILLLMLVRTSDRSQTLMAVLPGISAVFLMLAWVGSLIRTTGSSFFKSGVIGLGMSLLGVSVAMIGLLASVGHPGVGLVNGAISVLLLGGMAINRRMPTMFLPVWGCSAALMISLTGGWMYGSFDHWLSPDEVYQLLVSGYSGLALAFVGILALATHYVGTMWTAEVFARREPGRFGWDQVHLVSAAGLLGLGCVMAVVASFQFPADVFNAHVATSLLGAFALASLIAAIQIEKEGWQLLSCLVLYGFLGHLLFWNPATSVWASRIDEVVESRLLLLFTLASLILASAGLYHRFFHSEDLGLGPFTVAAILGTLMVIATGIFLLPAQTGLVSLAAVAALVTWFFVAWENPSKGVGEALIVISSLLALLFVADWVVRVGAVPELVHFDHGLIQVTVLASVAVTWVIAQTTLPKKYVGYIGLKPSRFLTEGEILVSSAIFFTMMVSMGVLDQTSRELNQNWESFLMPTIEAVGRGNEVLATGCILLVLTSAFYLIRPGQLPTYSVILVWLTTWLGGSIFFSESTSVGSAVRWLLPTGGLIGAAIFLWFLKMQPQVVWLRNRLSLSGPSSISFEKRQSMINFSLLFTVSGVLLISTVTIAVVMLKGPETLGGPIKPSWLGDLRKDVSFGGPIAILVATFLIYSISQKRSGLAVLGSGVFQYIVIASIALLALSPNPKLATEWFVKILQSVSLGMTAYGLVWYRFRKRIGGEPVSWLGTLPKVRQLELHTGLNVVLIGSLMVLILQRYFLYPTESAGWIKSVGGPLGIVATGMVALLCGLVWKDSRQKMVPWAVGFLGVAGSAILATLVDSFSKGSPWFAFRAIVVGTTATMICQLLVIGYRDVSSWKAARVGSRWPRWFATSHTNSSMLVFLVVATLFSLKGLASDSGGFWIHLVGALAVDGCIVFYGWFYRIRWTYVATSILSVVVLNLFIMGNPAGWFSHPSDRFYFSVAVLAWMAIGRIAFYLITRRSALDRIKRPFLTLPNVCVLFASVGVFLFALLELVASAFLDSLLEPNSCFALGSLVVLSLIQFWNDRARFRVASRLLMELGLILLAVSLFIDLFHEGYRDLLAMQKYVGLMMAIGLCSVLAGVVCLNRNALFRVLKRLGVPRLAATRRQMETQLPIWLGVFACVTLMLVWPAMITFDVRPLRYLAAAAPLMVAFGVGTYCRGVEREWLKLFCVSLVVTGLVIVSWAGMSPTELLSENLEFIARTLMVLAFCVFVLGALITRWVRHGDSWIPCFRKMTVGLSVLSFLCLLTSVLSQAAVFDVGVGSGLSPVSAIASSVLVLGMIVGLVVVAVQPKHDPLALSLTGRKGYIYLAQLVLVLLSLHVYLAMPWLLKLGVLKYWPYVAIAISFVTIAVSRVLQKRNLEVLSEPLFHIAALIPVLVSIGYWFVQSRADSSLTLLSAGLVYLMISVMHRSLVSGGLAVVFWNLALWLFYGKFPQFSIIEHPQLWLIPPAISVLVASQLLREKLSASQLGLIRYFCVFVIYLSSTGEIFIRGLGTSLWPPMVLATLSVMGMAAGILMQVRAYLYVGSVFLFMSMVAMVSHAHRQFDHVWPWWAFGICLGSAILVGFGLLEKRRNDLAAIARRLKQWDY